MAAEGGPAVDLRDDKTVRAAYFHMLVDWYGTDLQNVYEPLTDQFGYLYTMFLVIIMAGIAFGLYKKWNRKRRETPLPYKVIKPPINLTQSSTPDSSPKKRIVAVVGATGFAGSHIVKRLVQTGEYTVYALGRRFTDPEVVSLADGVFQIDMMNYEGLLSAFAGVDSIIHAAAAVPNAFISDDDLWRINVTGSENILSAARKCNVKSLVFITGHKPADEFKNKAAKIFSNALIHVEQVFMDANGIDGLQICALGFGHIYGLNTFHRKILKGEINRMPMSDVPISFISAWQVADAAIKAEKKLNEGSPLVAGKALSVMGCPGTMRQFFALPQWEVKIDEMSERMLLYLAKINEFCVTVLSFAPFGADLCSAICSFYDINLEEFDSQAAGKALNMDTILTVEEGVEKMRNEFLKIKQDKKNQ